MKFFARPVGIGVLFGLIGLFLTLLGLVRGAVPAQPASIAVAFVLGGGVWFLIAWAVATAAEDVEGDVAAQAKEPMEGVTSGPTHSHSPEPSSTNNGG